ncbi:MAG: hypothetical protein JNL32_09495 [Candidatus Kapabacteria bacterium]|nr:hypothetical protein [Candidatus Kapabacteria bacterium]
MVVKIVQGFVESQFKPEAIQGVLTDFKGVKVIATPEGEKNAGKELKREYMKPDFIFDFTTDHRGEKEHGYAKEAGEWLVKAPKLGEEGIILEPYGFSILSFDVGFVIAILITLIMPMRIGYMSLKIEREIHNNRSKVRLQTGFTDEIVELLTMPDDKLAALGESDRRRIAELYRVVWNRTTPDNDGSAAAAQTVIRFEDVFDKNTDIVGFRNNGLYIRIREHFSDFVEGEIEDIKHALGWQRNHLKIFAALRLYMAHHFTERYSNNVTGFAYGGAAILIIAVGIRGLKFIPSTRPSLILFAILLEFSMLALLAFVLFYTEEEERMDKMLKKMEDASRSQLDVLQEQQRDIRTFVDKLIGESSEVIKRRVEEAISEHLSDNDAMKHKISEAIVRNIQIGFKETLDKR